MVLRTIVRTGTLSCLVLIAGCAGGFSMKDVEVDRSILTGSVGKDAGSAKDPTRFSDEQTIRNAVSAADIEAAAAQPLAWANTDTGSRGAITALIERTEKNGYLCRSFTASRESFDGIGLFEGDACRTSAGLWQMRSFKPL